MKYYLAAPFVERALALTVREFLATKGYTCTSRWLDTHLGESIDDAAKGREAREDLQDIQRAQLFILLNSFPCSNGRAIETGYALAEGMRVWVVGPPSSIFHYLPAVTHFTTIKEIPDAVDR